MTRPLWKIEHLPRPTPAHAADAIEIVNGEAVRRVSLPQFDLEVYRLYQSLRDRMRREPHVRDLAAHLSSPLDELTAALRRLAVAGLITPPEPAATLQ